MRAWDALRCLSCVSAGRRDRDRPDRGGPGDRQSWRSTKTCRWRRITRLPSNSSSRFRKDHKFDFIRAALFAMFQMLASAINQAGSTDALKVALTLEGMKAEGPARPDGDDAQGRPPVAHALL